MYQVQIFPITPDVWRWEVRCGFVLLRCGTAATRQAADTEATQLIKAKAKESTR